MRYYEGIDYWVRYRDFPNKASESVVVSHGDGTFTILINTLFCSQIQRERLDHEIRHLTEEHFYRDDLSITQVEHAADGIKEKTPDPDPDLINVFFEHPAGWIPCFKNLDAMTAYLQKCREQHRKKCAVKKVDSAAG